MNTKLVAWYALDLALWLTIAYGSYALIDDKMLSICVAMMLACVSKDVMEGFKPSPEK